MTPTMYTHTAPEPSSGHLLQVLPVNPGQWKRLFPSPSHIFNTADFALLNASKASGVHFLTMADAKGKVRMGLIAGRRDGWLLSPFSAPFGGIEQCSPQRVEYWLDALRALRAYAAGAGCRLRLTLPPAPYGAHSPVDPQLLAAFSQGGVTASWADWNYHYDLIAKPGPDSSARNKLNSALTHTWGWEVAHGSPGRDSAAATDMLGRVYAVIQLNRSTHGYPLRMSLDDVRRTLTVVPMHLMLLTHKGVDVAAALVYDVAPGIAQVVYWGDVPGYSGLRPMNMLAHKVFGHFASLGYRVLDIGPSSSQGEPSTGLCGFKASLGCTLTPKFTFELG